MKRNSQMIRFIELPIIEHCNLNCAMCCRFSPIAEPSILDLVTFEADVKELARITDKKIVEIRLIGGEPLMVSNIIDYLKIVRENFPLTVLSIGTNGILLDSMDETFYEYMRDEEVTIKISNYINDRSGFEVIGKREKLRLAFTDKTQFAKFDLTDERTGDGQERYDNCMLGGACLTAYRGYVYICPTVSDLHIFNEKFGKNYTTTDQDKLELSSIDNIEQLLGFINGDKSNAFCTQCGRAEPNIKDWYVSQKTLDEWKK